MIIHTEDGKNYYAEEIYLHSLQISFIGTDGKEKALYLEDIIKITES